MAAYIVVPVILFTMLAVWLLVYMYDKRFKNPLSSTQSTQPATTCTNVRQEGIVYTISNTPADGATNSNGATYPSSGGNIRIETDPRAPPPQYGYTNQNLIVVTTIPRDLPPSYDQATRTSLS
ncbi:uncharacterized protein LOC128724523 [Anopheles nili]|uniref:uncharacterized protein LOC128724523 n=1 Tax=Anopheles nili TaxID=185578 RepID=UPI00237A6E70|nr:uncharacterized protein LOC128724523 [Anopheles nili]